MNKGFGIKKIGVKKEFPIDDVELKSQTNKAIHLAREGKLLESEKIYKDLISKGKYTYLTFHRLSHLYEKLGRKKEAINCLQKTINLKKDYAEGYSEIGKYLLDAGDIKSALNYFKRALYYNSKL